MADKGKRRGRGIGWVIAVAVVALAAVAGSYAASYTLQSEQREIANNVQEDVVVTAVAEERRASLAPITTVLGSQDTVDVQATLPEGAERAVVTSAPKQPGQPVASGDLLIAVSGKPVFGLALSMQLYRDLPIKSEGPDVKALNDALFGAGLINSSPGEDFTWITRIGVAEMYKRAGFVAKGENPGDLLPLDDVVDLPSGNAVAVTSPAVGAVVDVDTSVMRVAAPITSVTARIDVVSAEQLTPGVRASLSIPGFSDSVGGAITDISEFREASTASGTEKFAGRDLTIQLDAPLTNASGLTATVTFDLQQEPRVGVPVSAIRSSSTDTWVMIKASDGSFSRREVSVESESDGWALLSPSTELVTVGTTVRVSP